MMRRPSEPYKAQGAPSCKLKFVNETNESARGASVLRNESCVSLELAPDYARDSRSKKKNHWHAYQRRCERTSFVGGIIFFLETRIESYDPAPAQSPLQTTLDFLPDFLAFS